MPVIRNETDISVKAPDKERRIPYPVYCEPTIMTKARAAGLQNLSKEVREKVIEPYVKLYNEQHCVKIVEQKKQDSELFNIND